MDTEYYTSQEFRYISELWKFFDAQPTKIGDVYSFVTRNFSTKVYSSGSAYISFSGQLQEVLDTKKTNAKNKNEIGSAKNLYAYREDILGLSMYVADFCNTNRESITKLDLDIANSVSDDFMMQHSQDLHLISAMWYEKVVEQKYELPGDVNKMTVDLLRGTTIGGKMSFPSNVMMLDATTAFLQVNTKYGIATIRKHWFPHSGSGEGCDVAAASGGGGGDGEGGSGDVVAASGGGSGSPESDIRQRTLDVIKMFAPFNEYSNNALDGVFDNVISFTEDSIAFSDLRCDHMMSLVADGNSVAQRASGADGNSGADGKYKTSPFAIPWMFFKRGYCPSTYGLVYPLYGINPGVMTSRKMKAYFHEPVDYYQWIVVCCIYAIMCTEIYSGALADVRNPVSNYALYVTTDDHGKTIAGFLSEECQGKTPACMDINKVIEGVVTPPSA